MSFYEKRKFFNEHNLSGSQLALVVDIALRLTISDLKFRWWNSFFLRLGIWLVAVLVILFVPLFTMPIWMFLLNFSLQVNELGKVWVCLIGYSIVAALNSHLFFKSKMKTHLNKTIRRVEVYQLAILYKKQFMINE